MFLNVGQDVAIVLRRGWEQSNSTLKNTNAVQTEIILSKTSVRPNCSSLGSVEKWPEALAGFRWWGPGPRRGGKPHVRVQNL